MRLNAGSRPAQYEVSQIWPSMMPAATASSVSFADRHQVDFDAAFGALFNQRRPAFLVLELQVAGNVRGLEAEGVLLRGCRAGKDQGSRCGTRDAGQCVGQLHGATSFG